MKEYYKITFKNNTTCIGYYIGTELYNLEGFALNEKLITWIE